MNPGSVLGEGGTPLVPLDRLARRFGLGSLWAKCEHLNPTGSYKDRIAAASMRYAVDRGFRGWIATSSGNGGAAMAAYGRRAGLTGVLCVQSGAPAEKLASIRPYGVLMLEVPGMGPAVMDELERIAAATELLLTITTHRHNPVGMRGADMIGTEILAAESALTQVYVPCGGGGLLVATARGLAGASRPGSPGASRSGPAVVACQPEGCAPIALAAGGKLGSPVVAECTTAISGLQLAAPPDGEAAVAAVRESGGWGAVVSDEETWAAQDLLAREEGLFVEPAAAVPLAAVAADAACGRIGAADRVSVVLTGHGLKDLARYTSIGAPEICPVEALAERIGQVRR
ncbi:pyridoxal-phosphate dependent enzyme [Kribbella sp.]|uniref:pyridoxal-phosphate dependent enzyme n=1 Tax=Kribbella sp. TaxID=1871183 RepID=UPI002D569E0D|nr:pyridoxal-phosphate dependent enzyme [Kribbella sp.]HZX07820.1 pyridoxal-phosphate dependent enzyme [Kribbella sp.]